MRAGAPANGPPSLARVNLYGRAMNSAGVIRAHSYGVQIEADAPQPRTRGTVAPVAEANFASMRDQMIRANRSIAEDLDYQTQRATCAEKRAAMLERHVRQWKILCGAYLCAALLAVTLWRMAR